LILGDACLEPAIPAGRGDGVWQMFSVKWYVYLWIIWLQLNGAVAEEAFRFTAATDTHEYPGFTTTLQGILDFAGGPGAFFITTGDIGAIPSTGTRAMIDSVLGPDTVWFNAPGNHDVENYIGIGAMPWMR